MDDMNPIHKILTTTALCLAAFGLSSCNACHWLSEQCQQQASYVCYSYTLPKVASVRFVDKQGKLILEPSMNRPAVQEFADDLRYLVRIASSVEYAGGKLLSCEEVNVALYVDLIDANGAAFWRFPLRKESGDVNIFYFLPSGKCMGHGVPLEIGLSESEVTLLRQYSAR